VIVYFQEHPDVTAKSDADVAKWRAENEITVVGDNIPKPVTTFDTSPFPGKWVSA